LKQKHAQTGEDEARERINDLLGISWIGDLSEERGKKNQRNDGRWPSILGLNLAALPGVFLLDQKLPLSL
jgi:hypothetical protein